MQLTQREEQIMELMAEGLKTSLIAEKLGFSKRTIENRLQTIYKKHNIHSRIEAIVLYLKEK